MFATYVMDFNQGKFIMRNLENAYPHVDRIYVMHSSHSFANTSNIQYENSFDLNIIKNSPYMDKIVIIEGEWPSDIDTRNAALQRAKKDGVDFLMVHDADEYYFHDDFRKMINFVLENPTFDVYTVWMKVFWKSFKYIIVNNDDSDVSGSAQTVFNVKQCDHYDYVRDVFTNNKIAIPNVFCYHGSYVLTDVELHKKINTWAHSTDFDAEFWYKEVWLKWNINTKNLHPIWPWAWKETKEFTEDLPEVLKDFEILHIITPLGKGDILMFFGAITELAKYHRIFYYIRDVNFNDAKFLFTGIQNVTLVPTPFDNLLEMANDTKYITIGLGKPTKTDMPKYDQYDFFYEELGVLSEKRWENFHYERNLEQEKYFFYNTLGLKDDDKYVFVHEDESRGYVIDRKYFDSNSKIINTSDYKENSIFDFLYVIEHAQEIHVMNSVFMALIDLLRIKEDKLFCHNCYDFLYGTRHHVFFRRALNWNIINYNQPENNHTMEYIEYTFEGIHIGQAPLAFYAFAKIIKEFDLIIEIGTHAGGLTLMLHRLKDANTKLVSYDIDLSNLQVSSELGLDIREGDCFAKETFDEIKNLIATDARVLMVCDGGQKNREVSEFSGHLKKDDVIMCHDYIEIQEEWDSYCIIQNWLAPPESSWDAVKDALEYNGVDRHPEYDYFKQALWGIFIKK